MFDEIKKSLVENLALYPHRGMACVEWSRRGVPFISSGFIYFIVNTSNRRMKHPFGIIELTTVTRDPHSVDWTEDIWHLPFNPKIFVCLCCTIVMQVSSCRIMLNGVHRVFLDLKILSCWFRSETPRSWEWRTSVVVTEISWWWHRKFFNHFLPVF
jgi:hypothetical protein